MYTLFFMRVFVGFFGGWGWGGQVVKFICDVGIVGNYSCNQCYLELYKQLFFNEELLNPFLGNRKIHLQLKQFLLYHIHVK